MPLTEAEIQETTAWAEDLGRRIPAGLLPPANPFADLTLFMANPSFLAGIALPPISAEPEDTLDRDIPAGRIAVIGCGTFGSQLVGSQLSWHPTARYAAVDWTPHPAPRRSASTASPSIWGSGRCPCAGETPSPA